MLKRIFSIFAISLIITGLFFEGYTMKCPVYADDVTDGWMNVTTNEELSRAFIYYCKSRDLTIDGSGADWLTKFTTKTFQGLCNAVGIDMTALQAQIKYRTDSNLGLQYLFTATGIDAYNQLFAQFLQDRELEVGDEVPRTDIYNGYKFTDDNGNWCWVWQLNTTSTSISPSSTNEQLFNDYGTNFIMNGGIEAYNVFYDNGGVDDSIYFSFYKYQTKYDYLLTHSQSSNSISINGKNSTNAAYYAKTLSTDAIQRIGEPTIIKNANGDIYTGIVGTVQSSGLHYAYMLTKITGNDIVTNATIYITTNNNVINNNNYEGDTIINNDGDIINNYPDEPDLPPSNPTIPDDGGWQDFQLPSMPNDWLIYGMEKKFPFDIPFNIMFALSLLNHEPEIPQFEGDIDLKVCTWHYDIDLTPFDDIATILRRFEVLAFIIGLAILTKELIMWG